MKVGDKYVIEIEEVIRRNGAPQIARIKGFNALVFDKYGLEKLEPYDDQKIFNMGFEAGKNAVINEYKKKHNSDIDYKDGLEDGRMEAWECARKIRNMDIVEKEAIFAEFGKATWQVIDELSPSEAIARIKEYEEKQKQDAEIKVGDEVVDDKGRKAVVSRVDNDGYYIIVYYNGDTNCVASITKTGRHFPQIAEVLAELRGEE